jgi:hypothetical protein
VGQDVVVHLDRVSAEELDAEALELGFIAQPHRYVPESEQYLGSTVVVLKAPRRDEGRGPREPR